MKKLLHLSSLLLPNMISVQQSKLIILGAHDGFMDNELASSISLLQVNVMNFLHQN